MTGRLPPPTRHNAAPAPSTLPEELLLAALSWYVGMVRSRHCRLSTTAPTECWSGQHTSSSLRWGIEPTKCPRSA
jgi:hypothetical protein